MLHNESGLSLRYNSFKLTDGLMPATATRQNRPARRDLSPPSGGLLHGLGFSLTFHSGSGLDLDLRAALSGDDHQLHGSARGTNDLQGRLKSEVLAVGSSTATWRRTSGSPLPSDRSTWGIVADMIAVRWFYPLMLMLWSLAGCSTGFVRDYDELLWSRTFLGFFRAAPLAACALQTTQRISAGETDLGEQPSADEPLRSGRSLTPLLVMSLLQFLRELAAAVLCHRPRRTEVGRACGSPPSARRPAAALPRAPPNAPRDGGAPEDPGCSSGFGDHWSIPSSRSTHPPGTSCRSGGHRSWRPTRGYHPETERRWFLVAFRIMNDIQDALAIGYASRVDTRPRAATSARPGSESAKVFALRSHCTHVHPGELRGSAEGWMLRGR